MPMFPPRSPPSLASLASAALVVTLLVGRTAAAAPCNALGGAEDDSIPILYIENGDTQEPLLKRFGKQLMQTAGPKLRIVYRNRPTCELAASFYGALPARDGALSVG